MSVLFGLYISNALTSNVLSGMQTELGWPTYSGRPRVTDSDQWRKAISPLAMFMLFACGLHLIERQYCFPLFLRWSVQLEYEKYNPFTLSWTV